MNTTPNSFNEQIDWDALYGDLAVHGQALSVDKQKELREACEEDLNNHNPYKLISGSFGAKITNGLYRFLAFIQNLFTGKSVAVMDRVSNAADRAGKLGDLDALNKATISIYQRLIQSGFSQDVAELVSGQSTDGSPQEMSKGIYRQLRGDIDLPLSTTSSLNRVQGGDHVTETTPPLPQSMAVNKSNIDARTPSA
jgi:hypothetical protein